MEETIIRQSDRSPLRSEHSCRDPTRLWTQGLLDRAGL